MDSEALHAVSDDELLRRIGELVSRSRRVEADLVAYIGEVDERRLFARMAFPSMFAYCTQGLHLSEAEAYRRITVARAARRHGVLLAMLRDGRLHLSGIVTLLPVLTAENREQVLARAAHRSKRQLEELVAELSPRPDMPAGMRRIPEQRGPSRLVSDSAGVALSPRAELVPGRADAGDGTGTVGAGASGPLRSVDTTAAELLPGRVERSAPARVEALSPGRYRVQFTASASLREKLERLAALMRPEVPNGDIAGVVERAVTEALERLEARRFGRTGAPRKPSATRSAIRPATRSSPASRHVPAAVRRAVVERDEGRCRFVDAEGRRCSERHRLEFHHRHPFAMGGSHDAGNVSLLCAQHNRYLAERDFGSAAIRRHVTPGGG